MKLLKSFMPYFLTIILLSACLHSSAATELKWFDPEEPYEDVPFVSVEYVCFDEYIGSGHAAMELVKVYTIINTVEQLEHTTRFWPDWYDMNASYLGLSSPNEQLQKYDEAYFEDYVLVLAIEESNFLQTDTGRTPTPIPLVYGAYLQNNRVFVDDRTEAFEGELIEGDHLEYYTFITIERTIYEEKLSDIIAFTFLGNRSHQTPQAPQTSDPTTTLTITTAVSLTALCLLPVAGRKRRQR